jgi:hypothetical protein
MGQKPRKIKFKEGVTHYAKVAASSIREFVRLTHPNWQKKKRTQESLTILARALSRG